MRIVTIKSNIGGIKMGNEVGATRQKLVNDGYVSVKTIDTKDAKSIFIDCGIPVQLVETTEVSECLEVLVRKEAKDTMYVYETPDIFSKTIGIIGVADEVIILVPKGDGKVIRLS